MFLIKVEAESLKSNKIDQHCMCSFIIKESFRNIYSQKKLLLISYVKTSDWLIDYIGLNAVSVNISAIQISTHTIGFSVYYLKGIKYYDKFRDFRSLEWRKTILSSSLATQMMTPSSQMMSCSQMENIEKTVTHMNILRQIFT